MELETGQYAEVSRRNLHRRLLGGRISRHYGGMLRRGSSEKRMGRSWSVGGAAGRSSSSRLAHSDRREFRLHIPIQSLRYATDARSMSIVSRYCSTAPPADQAPSPARIPPETDCPLVSLESSPPRHLRIIRSLERLVAANEGKKNRSQANNNQIINPPPPHRRSHHPLLHPGPRSIPPPNHLRRPATLNPIPHLDNDSTRFACERLNARRSGCYDAPVD